MFSDFGRKIRRLAITIGILGTVASLVGMVVLFKNHLIISIALAICGPLVCWIGSMILFGFGVLLDNMEEMIENTGEIIVNGRKQIESIEELIEQNRSLLENNREQKRNLEELLEISKSIQTDLEEEKQALSIPMEAPAGPHSQTEETGSKAAIPHLSTAVPQILKNLKVPDRLTKYIENLQGNPSERGK